MVRKGFQKEWIFDRISEQICSRSDQQKRENRLFEL